MTNISKQNIKNSNYEIAYRELTTLISRLNKTNAHFLIEELLTESEKVMLVKRFAATFMFSQNYSPYRVSDTLGMSDSTARRIYQQYRNGNFTNLLKAIPKKTESEFLLLINDLILAQVSPRARARLMNRVL